MEQFYTFNRDMTDDISAHVAKLQQIFTDLNAELKKQGDHPLSEKMLIGRIMCTLGPEYHEFRNVWEAMNQKERTINTLLEKLCAIELRTQRTTGDLGAYVAKTGVGQSTDRDSVNAGGHLKSGGKKVDPRKRWPCRICKKKGHWKDECPELKSKTSKSNKPQGKSANEQGKHSNAFSAYTCRIPADYWCCDSGASQHMTSNKQYFATFVRFAAPVDITLANKQVMRAYGTGKINVEMNINGQWKSSYLQDVWYVPNVGRHLFSVRKATEHGYTVVMDKNRVVFKRNNEICASGSYRFGMYVIDMRVYLPSTPAEVNIATVADTLQVYHERMAHQNKQHIKSVLKNIGVDVRGAADDEFCDGCAIGKAHRLPFKTRTERGKSVGEIINADVAGPMSVNSVGGARYYVCFKDDYSKFRRIFFLKHKNEVADCLSTFLNEAQTAGHTVKTFLCDGGTEFTCNAVRNILNKHGILLRVIPPSTPEQNGASERENRTIVEAGRSMLNPSGLPKSLWAEASYTAVYVLNRTGKTGVKGKSPFELWYGRNPGKLDNLRIFGTGCYVHIPKQFRNKLDNKSIFGHLVGYVNDKDGFRVWIPSKRTVVCSHDVIFKPEQTCSTTSVLVVYKTANKSTSTIEGSIVEKEEIETPVDTIEIVDQDNSEDDEDAGTPGAGLRRSERVRKPPQWMCGGEYACYAELTGTNPTTYSEAMKSEQRQEWLSAMNEELAAHAKNETWELVERPDGMPLMQNRWVLRIKPLPDGSERYKARLVAKGYTQKQGIDYDETFSPVARYDTIRVLLAVAASTKMRLRQFDIKTAFLYGELQEEVYMAQPEGFHDSTNRVCRLRKSLYGLKQAPRCWNMRFVDFMKSQEMHSSSADPCLFVRETDDSKLYVAIYVDDGLVVGSNDAEIDAFIENLNKEFEITTGSLSCFLGMQIHQQDGSIFVNQKAYTKKILDQFNMADANPVSIPVDQSSGGSDNPIGENVPYREAVGCLMYLSTATRPDIAFAVSRAARVMDKPEVKDWIEVKRIFKYLKGTSDYGLMYHSDDDTLKVYSDADYAGDLKTRRSTSGVIAMYAGGAISWTSQLQRSVALSTTEAEVIAASEGAKELIWLKRLLSELSVLGDLPVLYVDNLSAVKLAKNPEFHKRSKHVEVRHFFVRERYLDGDIGLEHIEGVKQLADILTKPLARVRFKKLRSEIGVNCGDTFCSVQRLA